MAGAGWIWGRLLRVFAAVQNVRKKKRLDPQQMDEIMGL
jgi:hypothetical protein